ncbi:MAG: hypothetical protein HRT61_19985, partial [Ekhidna sp.]|nr:hypothetical protein [Ekhidna sp.]
KLVITSCKIDGVEQDNDHRIVIPVGATTIHTMQFQVAQADPLSEQVEIVTEFTGQAGLFAMPISRIDGRNYTTLGIQFTDGVATVTRTWDTAGEFVITQEGANLHSGKGRRVLLDDLAFSVYEPKVRDGQIADVSFNINVDSVTGAEQVNSTLTWITATENTNLLITGELLVPDRVFSMCLRRDDGRLVLFPASVVGGKFSVIVNFPTSGQYTFDDISANTDLPLGTFFVETIKIDVLRKVESSGVEGEPVTRAVIEEVPEGEVL